MPWFCSTIGSPCNGKEVRAYFDDDDGIWCGECNGEVVEKPFSPEAGRKVE